MLLTIPTQKHSLCKAKVIMSHTDFDILHQTWQEIHDRTKITIEFAEMLGRAKEQGPLPSNLAAMLTPSPWPSSTL